MMSLVNFKYSNFFKDFTLSNEDRENANDMFKFAKAANPNFHIDQIAADSDNDKDTMLAVLQVTIPWLVLLIVSIVGWFCYFICCAFDW